MDLFDAISLRHSYRGGFTDAPVPRSDLKKIVQAGVQAPSGCNAQTTSFVIVDDTEIIRRIAGIMPGQVVDEAQVLIVCVVDHRPVYQGKSFGVEDCAAAVQNMLLAITSLGYATVWIDGALRAEGRAESIAGILEIPSNLEVRILLPLGVASETCSQKEKMSFDQRAGFNRFVGNP